MVVVCANEAIKHRKPQHGMITNTLHSHTACAMPLCNVILQRHCAMPYNESKFKVGELFEVTLKKIKSYWKVNRKLMESNCKVRQVNLK